MTKTYINKTPSEAEDEMVNELNIEIEKIERIQEELHDQIDNLDNLKDSMRFKVGTLIAAMYN